MQTVGAVDIKSQARAQRPLQGGRGFAAAIGIPAGHQRNLAAGRKRGVDAAIGEGTASVDADDGGLRFEMLTDVFHARGLIANLVGDPRPDADGGVQRFGVARGLRPIDEQYAFDGAFEEGEEDASQPVAAAQVG